MTKDQVGFKIMQNFKYQNVAMAKQVIENLLVIICVGFVTV